MFLLADVVWPALYLADRILAFEVIVLGLCIEALLLRRAFQMTWKRAFVVTTVMNLVSSVVGAILLPVWGWYWADATLKRDAYFGWGTFNVLSWAETCCFAWLVTTIVEWLPLRLMAGRQRHLLVVLLAANFLSVGLAYLSFNIVPPSRWPWDHIEMFQFIPMLY